MREEIQMADLVVLEVEEGGSDRIVVLQVTVGSQRTRILLDREQTIELSAQLIEIAKRRGEVITHRFPQPVRVVPS